LRQLPSVRRDVFAERRPLNLASAPLTVHGEHDRDRQADPENRGHPEGAWLVS
jgi:hypothetical protein